MIELRSFNSLGGPIMAGSMPSIISHLLIITTRGAFTGIDQGLER
jgi:hypothetical protein